MSSPKSTVFIRPAALSDSPALSRICLLTCNAGASGEALHKAKDLPGIVYSEPFLRSPHAVGFVLVDSAKDQDDYNGVVGYTVASHDTRAFEAFFEAQWLPPYLQKYPLAAVDSEPTADTPAHLRGLLPDDIRYIRRIHNSPVAAEYCIAFSPARMHINILPEYQHCGWGRRLIGSMVRHLKEERGLERVWLGMDPKNENAGRFYHRVGFKDLPPDAPGHAILGLDFADWAE